MGAQPDFKSLPQVEGASGDFILLGIFTFGILLGFLVAFLVLRFCACGGQRHLGHSPVSVRTRRVSEVGLEPLYEGPAIRRRNGSD